MENSTENSQSATPATGTKYRRIEVKPGRDVEGGYLPDSMLEEAALSEQVAVYGLDPVDLHHLPLRDLIVGALCDIVEDPTAGDGRNAEIQFIQALGIDLKCFAAAVATGFEGGDLEASESPAPYAELTHSDIIAALRHMHRRALYGAELLARMNRSPLVVTAELNSESK